MMKIAICVACCVAVITTFPMYGPNNRAIFQQPLKISKGFGGAYCPTHGSFDGGHNIGFDASIHGDRFNPLGLVGYYGQYENIKDNVGIIPSSGRQGVRSFGGLDNDFNNDRFDNNRGFDNFDDNSRGFDNFNDNSRGFDNFDDSSRGFDNFNDNNRGFDNFNDNNRGFNNFDNGILGNDDSRIGQTGPILRGAFPAGPIQRDAFPRVRIGNPGRILNNEFNDLNNGPLDNFDNHVFNNDLGFIHDQISHK